VPTGPFTITVMSTDPTTMVPVTASPADANGVTAGNSSFTLTYAAGTKVTLTAQPTSGLEIFNKWSGCTTSVGPTCTFTATSNTTVNAVYEPQISLSLQPQYGCCAPPYDVAIGTGEQIYVHATLLNGLTNSNVTFSLAGPPGYTGNLGGLSIQGGNEYYQSPDPAPAYVTLTATSVFDPVATASVVFTLGQLPGATGAGVAALTVDTSAVTHTISPLIYGYNQFGNDPTLQAALKFPMDRWGGDAATRYNYLLDQYNSASDYYFETNANSNTAYPDTSMVNTQITQDEQYGATSLITVPLVGYTTQSPGTGAAERAFACGMSIAKYGAQQKADPYNTDCGNGETSSGYPPINWGAPVPVGAFTVGNGPKRVTDPADTSIQIDPSYTLTPGTASAPVNASFDSTWVSYLVNKFGTAAKGGVGIYELDNEPEYWSGVHQDVHPFWMTYDEVTNKGIAYATAIKTADPSAQVSGPVISGYQNFFYSTADQWAGYNFGDSGDGYCYCYNSNPADQVAHGNVPLLAYYLQQMSAASATAGYRLLDYLDLHGYYAAKGAADTTAGDTGLQAAREDSTRFLWDPTYLDTNGNTDPTVIANKAGVIAIQMIPFMKSLVAANYPGTKTAITEYNFGGEESISGAIAEAEALAVMGWQGLDMASLWSEPLGLSDSTYAPTQQAFNFFLNYDGAGSKFGDGSLNTNSTITGGLDVNGNPLPPYFGGSQMSIYAAKRSSDGAITVLVFNKSFQDLTSSVTLTTTATSASVYQLSMANLTAITSQPAVTVTSGVATTTFPAQSITLLVFPD
jgi:hypothetical protein